MFECVFGEQRVTTGEETMGAEQVADVVAGMTSAPQRLRRRYAAMAAMAAKPGLSFRCSRNYS